jgi:hypothetical protein
MWVLPELRYARITYLLVAHFEELLWKFGCFLTRADKQEKVDPRDADDWTL